MKKGIKWIAGVAALILLVGGAYLLYDRLATEYTPGDRLASGQEGDSEVTRAPDAPDFTVDDYNGAPVSLSDFKGTPVVLNFWASWCPPCREEMPDFNAAFKAHPDVQFMMVNMTDGFRETLSHAKEHVEDEGYDFPVFFDVSYNASTAYGVTSLPATYFIDRQGRVVAYASGMIDSAALESGIEMIK